jgi:hypothetical protein
VCTARRNVSCVQVIPNVFTEPVANLLRAHLVRCRELDLGTPPRPIPLPHVPLLALAILELYHLLPDFMVRFYSCRWPARSAPLPLSLSLSLRACTVRWQPPLWCAWCHCNGFTSVPCSWQGQHVEETVRWTLYMEAHLATTFHVPATFDRKLFRRPLAKFLNRFPEHAYGADSMQRLDSDKSMHGATLYTTFHHEPPTLTV